MKFLGVWGLLAAVGIVVAAPPTNNFLGIHTLGLDNRTAGAAIHPPPENDDGCGSQPHPEPQFYNSVTKGTCGRFSCISQHCRIDGADKY